MTISGECLKTCVLAMDTSHSSVWLGQFSFTGLDKRRPFSTIKVDLAAIAACHVEFGGLTASQQCSPIDLTAFTASPGEECSTRLVRSAPTWIGGGTSGGAIISLSPGPVATKASLLQSSASPTGWWRQLLWLTLIRVSSHLGVYALVLPRDWPLHVLIWLTGACIPY